MSKDEHTTQPIASEPPHQAIPTHSDAPVQIAVNDNVFDSAYAPPGPGSNDLAAVNEALHRVAGSTTGGDPVTIPSRGQSATHTPQYTLSNASITAPAVKVLPGVVAKGSVSGEAAAFFGAKSSV